LKDKHLYDAILRRRSVRRYDAKRVDDTTLKAVQSAIDSVIPLVEANSFHANLQSVAPGENLAEAMGAYGRIITPPHYIIPYIEGNDHPLSDLGCRVEQIFVRLTVLGLGGCFIGALGREGEIRQRFDLPPSSRIAAFLIFGHPAIGIGGRVVNRAMRLSTGATNKMPSNKLFFDGSFENPSIPPPDLVPLIEAARNAPSAVDAQPWRFLWKDGRLYLFVKRSNPKYGGGVRVDYRLYDGGICLGNMLLAMEAMGREGKWTLLDANSIDISAYPDYLEPLAVLSTGR
jgi:nitroreductase